MSGRQGHPLVSIQVALHHRTTYQYDRPVALGPQVVRLRPAPHSRTRILSYSMRVEPTTHFVNWQQDPQSNYLARLVFPKATTFFRVEIDLVAEMAVFNPFDFFLEPSAENFPFRYEPEHASDPLTAFMAGDLAWAPAPHERLFGADGLFVQRRGLVEKVVFGGAAYYRPDWQSVARHAPKRVRDVPDGVLCSLWALGRPLEDHRPGVEPVPQAGGHVNTN